MDETGFQRDLRAWRDGDQAAAERLYAGAWDELKSVARRSLRAYGRGDQLQTTMLVNECYLKLASAAEVEADTRHHFMALCARAMRQVIVDSARRQLADKRGGQMAQVELEDHVLVDASGQALGPEAIAALDEAVTRLGEREPRLARIAECKVFAGMETAEIAAALGVTERTVQREWMRIKALLTLVLEG